MKTLTRKTPLPAKWHELDAGAYGAEAVMFDGDWYAIYDRDPRRIIGRPLECLVYYRKDFDEFGCRESRLMVATDNSAKMD